LNNSNKITLILGASTNPSRYAYIAAERLLANNHSIYLLGAKANELFGEVIHTEFPPIADKIDTITIYLSVKNQFDYYENIIDSKPRRVIFNPGSENHEFAALLKENNIEVLFACTLVLLSTRQY